MRVQSRLNRPFLAAPVYDDDGCVGEVYRQPDILNPGKHYYVIRINEDPRGPLRVFERSRIREEARLGLRSPAYY